ncbi:MAG: aldehyde ferredoxin oxidoreductase family protein [Thermoplasmatales archaeon]
MEGNWNKFLNVNLETDEIWDEGLSEDEWERWIGGVGIGVRLFSKIFKGNDPLSPDNPIVIMTGPLVGTPFPNSGRHEIISRSPLTGLLGESNSGGFFGNELKKAGYDGLIIRGSSQVPKVITIDESVKIAEVPELWGKDFYFTREFLRKEKKYSVMGIGRAGENSVYFSSIMNDEGRAAGRTGLGAVMGSKKLKAIAVKGTLQVPVSDRKRFFDLIKKVSGYLIESPLSQGLKSNGSMIWMDMGQGMNDIPANYFKDHKFDYDSLSSMKFHGLYNVTSYHCANCVIGCGRTVRVGSKNIDGPEYETVASLGPLLGNSDFDLILRWNDLINDAGMDTISTGVLISGIKSYLDEGILKNSELEGYFQDGFKHISDLIEEIVAGNGIGKELRKGLYRFSTANGIPIDRIATIKKMEIPMHDPRAFKLQGLGYATSTRGADHLQAEMYEVDMGVEDRKIGIISGDRWNVNSEERVRTLINVQNYRQIYNSAILCTYAKVSSDDVAEALSVATGFDFSVEDLISIGKNIIEEKKKINEKLGWKPEDDYIPKIVRERIDGEPEESGTQDDEMKALLKRYRDQRGWV